MSLTYDSYIKKVNGCWLGKSVGGTLGGPYEGDRGPLNLTYYDPVPTEMLPNDDLDLQVVWLETIRRKGLPVNRYHFALAWQENIHLWPDEYGVAHRNISRGLFPPVSGSFDNKFTDGMGASIRSELWACLSMGNPEIAVALANEDATADHDEEGLYAARFLAAAESLAFTESDRDRIVERALSFIPSSSQLQKAFQDTRHWWESYGDWKDVRAKIIEKYGSQNFTYVVPNLSFILLGWLAGNGNFGDSICTAVNCGLDTDCTGATLGAMLGIMQPESIEEKWLKPIGYSLVLSPGMVGMHQGETLDKFTQQVAETAIDLHKYYGAEIFVEEIPDKNDSLRNSSLSPDLVSLKNDYNRRESLVCINPLVLNVVYSDSVAFYPDATDKLALTITNPSEIKTKNTIYLNVPYGWEVKPAFLDFDLEPGKEVHYNVEITAPKEENVRTYRNMLDFFCETNGIKWEASAGLIQTIPWLKRSNRAHSWEKIESPYHFQTVPKGNWEYQTEMKIPYRGTFMVLTQGHRKMKTFIDDELVNEFDGSEYVPAMHRNTTGTNVYLDRGWHCITIIVEDGAEGEMFFGIGINKSGSWIYELEWRLPLNI